MLYEILDDIKNTSSTLEKTSKLLEAFKNKYILTLFEYAYNPFKVYGIKKLKLTSDGIREITDNDLLIFFQFLDFQLKNPRASKQASKQLELFFSKFKFEEQEYLLKVINKERSKYIGDL